MCSNLNKVVSGHKGAAIPRVAKRDKGAALSISHGSVPAGSPLDEEDCGDAAYCCTHDHECAELGRMRVEVPCLVFYVLYMPDLVTFDLQYFFQRAGIDFACASVAKVLG